MNRGVITISETGAVTIPTTPVWMTPFEIADLFGFFPCHVRKAIRSVYKNEEMGELDAMEYIRQADGISYYVYNLEMIVAIAFRIYSKESTLFRQFVINRLSVTTKRTSFSLFVYCGRNNNLWYS